MRLAPRGRTPILLVVALLAGLIALAIAGLVLGDEVEKVGDEPNVRFDPAPNLVVTREALGEDGEIYLEWEGTPGAIGYVVLIASEEGGDYTLISCAPEDVPSDELIGLSTGSRKSIIVRPIGQNPNSRGSNETLGDSGDARLEPPSNLVAATGASHYDQIRLDWKPTRGAIGYVVLVTHEEGDDAVIPGPGRPPGPRAGPPRGLDDYTLTHCAPGVDPHPITLVGLTSGVRYFFVVRAIGERADSPNSNVASAVAR